MLTVMFPIVQMGNLRYKVVKQPEVPQEIVK